MHYLPACESREMLDVAQFRGRSRFNPRLKSKEDSLATWMIPSVIRIHDGNEFPVTDFDFQGHLPSNVHIFERPRVASSETLVTLRGSVFDKNPTFPPLLESDLFGGEVPIHRRPLFADVGL